jgi:hypothetical protein
MELKQQIETAITDDNLAYLPNQRCVSIYFNKEEIVDICKKNLQHNKYPQVM